MWMDVGVGVGVLWCPDGRPDNKVKDNDDGTTAALLITQTAHCVVSAAWAWWVRPSPLQRALIIAEPAANQRAVGAGGLFGFCFGVHPPGQGRRGASKQSSLLTHNCMLPFRASQASQMRGNRCEMLRSRADQGGSMCALPASWTQYLTD